MSTFAPCPKCGKPVYAFQTEPSSGDPSIIDEWVECTSFDCDYQAMEVDHVMENPMTPAKTEIATGQLDLFGGPPA